MENEPEPSSRRTVTRALTTSCLLTASSTHPLGPRASAQVRYVHLREEFSRLLNREGRSRKCLLHLARLGVPTLYSRCFIGGLSRCGIRIVSLRSCDDYLTMSRLVRGSSCHLMTEEEITKIQQNCLHPLYTHMSFSPSALPSP